MKPRKSKYGSFHDEDEDGGEGEATPAKPALAKLAVVTTTPSSTAAPASAAHHTKTSDPHVVKSLQKRMKIILKEPSNKVCSECKSRKPKWISLLQAPIDQERKQLGVLCCGDCQAYHAALGEELCILKSLKHAEECKY
jgi:Putative GTPase activating protein for Arf